MPGRRKPTINKPSDPPRRFDLPAELTERVERELGEKSQTDPEAFESLMVKAVEEYLGKREGLAARGGSTRSDTVFKSSRGPTGPPPTGRDQAPLSPPGEQTGSAAGGESPAGLLRRSDWTTLELEPRDRASGTEGRPEAAPDVARADLVQPGEMTHPGARRVFERTIKELEQSRLALEEATDGRDFAGAAYRAARDRLLDEQSIRLPDEPAETAGAGEVLHAPRDRPLFGLHNRDYPSLWALMLLAEAVSDGPVPWSEFASGLQLAADPFGGALGLIDKVERPGLGLKYSSSFPDPKKKAKGGQWIKGIRGRKTARLYPFVKNTFARIQKGRVGIAPEARGPLPRWDAVRFLSRDGELFVEPAAAGYRLLRAVEGASLRLPHGPGTAQAFLSHLIEHSPGDAAGFLRVLTAIRDKGERQAVVDANLAFFNGYLEREEVSEDKKYASSMTQGYVARAREWGLVEPGMFASPHDGAKVYRLTEEGERAISLLDS